MNNVCYAPRPPRQRSVEREIKGICSKKAPFELLPRVYREGGYDRRLEGRNNLLHVFTIVMLTPLATGPFFNFD